MDKKTLTNDPDIKFSFSRSADFGKVGEYLICADLILRGYQAFIVSDPASPFDIVLNINGKLLKVQVKTTVTQAIHYVRKDMDRVMPTYVFKVGACGWSGKKKHNADNVDIYALVVLSTREIAYVAFDTMRSNVSFRIPALRGQYFNEKMNGLVPEIRKLISEGKTHQEVSDILCISTANVFRYNKKGIHKRYYNIGTYFDENTFERCLEKLKSNSII